LGRDPEVRATQDGRELVNLALATSESWKDRNTGERKEKTEWHRIVIFNDGLVNVAKNYLRKGSKIYIEGQLQTRKWQDQNGQERYSTEVVLQGYNGNLTMLDGRSGGGADNSNEYNQDMAPRAAAGGSGGGAAQPVPQHNDLDDEIPF